MKIIIIDKMGEEVEFISVDDLLHTLAEEVSTGADNKEQYLIRFEEYVLNGVEWICEHLNEQFEAEFGIKYMVVYE